MNHDRIIEQAAVTAVAAVDMHLSDKGLTCGYQVFLNDMLVHKRGQNQLQLYNHLSFDFYQFSSDILKPRLISWKTGLKNIKTQNVNFIFCADR